MSSDPLWYKDAVFYELHVKAFQDSNGDGVGDFRGLIERLDYVRDLGVSAIWLLPFYPSPLRDDGYDIADYYGINPQYGTVDDFQAFLDAAHERGLKVIADLVLNHTSDQHPWFQRARRAPKGSPERDFYVWSDTDETYSGVRIIFTDTEPSNWTWDPVAGQYYWHRFFAHQPDLNWDNPAVKEAMFQVMEFWLERGLDGFRADAVPYLIEREGTICENLPETHDILKEFRARLDRNYPGRILLAEANQWPDDVRPYFGDGDEFQMAFHFPLMPRIFMAVRQGIRKPIVEIIQRTPAIPPDCQWCMFLRNHDELTLEMVTDEERDYMYAEYARDPRMRLNLGIRRRLAPLMDNDRRRIELLNSILFTMPGSPVVYYGDEIGMGDNIWLGDRDGVRTPMQWSLDRNGGFSRAEAARLYLPAVTDSVYGYQAINVESQERSPYSALNWMKRLIQVRKAHHAFGRGTIDFLEPDNPHVLAYVREHEGDDVLVVNNLSGTAQAVQLDLSRFSGRTLVEMLGNTPFLPIADTPYALTLSPYGFFWFALRAVKAEGDEDETGLPAEWAEREAALLASPASLAALTGGIPHEWLLRQRWFRGKAREIASIEMQDGAVLEQERGPRTLLSLVRVRYAEGEPETYLLPVAFRPTAQPGAEAESLLTHAGESGDFRVYEALADRRAPRALLEMIRDGAEVRGAGGAFRGHRTPVLDAVQDVKGPVRAMAAEQSNTSIVFGNRLILKVFRKVEAGVNPDLEVSRFLLERTAFRASPALAGWIDYTDAAGATSSVAALFEYVPNSGDAWAFTGRALARYFAAASRSAADPDSVSGREAVRRMMGDYLPAVRRLGEVTGQMHAALASAGADEPDFAPEPITLQHVRGWAEAMRREAQTTVEEVGRRLDRMPGYFPGHVQNALATVTREAAGLASRMDDLYVLADAGAVMTRMHGDYHLGQVLRADVGLTGDWAILDYEGEPARSLPERRAKHSPLRDVAGMLRSFDYALRMAVREHDTGAMGMRESLGRWGDSWLGEVRGAFLGGYLAAAGDAPFLPRDGEAFTRALAVFELQKAIYELGYEMNNRPEWIWVPLLGIQAIVGGAS
ncbi:MAG: trehalose synthase/probable maltokinase [Gemmatimonadetes bacterium]|nr:trehalose synthase/probable maltokinase [Gemmatimonadota bacterium]